MVIQGKRIKSEERIYQVSLHTSKEERYEMTRDYGNQREAAKKKKKAHQTLVNYLAKNLDKSCGLKQSSLPRLYFIKQPNLKI